MQKQYINMVRFWFAGLFLFEALNFFRVIGFTPTFTWLGLLITTISAWLLLELVDGKLKGGVPAVVWLLVAVSLTIDAFGDIFHWYTLIPYYDKMAHFVISGMLTLVVWMCLWPKRESLSKKMSLSFFWIIFATVQTFGVVYELEEYWEDFFLDRGFVRWGGGVDTAYDMSCNLFGSLTALLIVVLYMRLKKRRIRRIK